MSTTKEGLALPAMHRIGMHQQRGGPRSQGFTVQQGIAVERSMAERERRPRTDAGFQEMLQSRKLGETMGHGATTGAQTRSRDAPLPKHVLQDKVVLGFDCYFNEAVTESRVENYRTRYLHLRYYVVDDTVELVEPKRDNAALPQGNFLSRCKIPKLSGGGSLDWLDLSVGSEIPVYGRVLRLVACDAFTRDWYARQGIEQPSNESVPGDLYTTTRKAVDAQNTGKDSTIYRGKVSHPMKRFMESTLGNASAAQIRGVKDELRKFLEHDREVLRFYGVWDDRAAPYGEKQHFRINYFLADDNIEVLEMHTPNNGKHRFPALLRKQPVPRHVMNHDDRTRGIEDDNGESDYLTLSDLRVGKEVHILGRDVLLYKADPFTVRWFKDNRGEDIARDFIELDDEGTPTPRLKAPPPTGYGNPEDSLSSWMFLIPKVPKPDMEKKLKYDGVKLRFKAKAVTGDPIDREREYVVAWYMADDHMQIYEVGVRNSGIVGGKFMAKCRVMNPDSGSYFRPADLYVGARIRVKGLTFELVGADSFSLSTMEADPATWPLSSRRGSIEAFRSAVDAAGVRPAALLSAIDKEPSDFLFSEDVVRALEATGVKVPTQALLTVMRAIATQQDQGITGADLLALLQ